MDSGDDHQRLGWWQASDLNWYPPESHPHYKTTLPAPPTSYPPARTADSGFESAGRAQRAPRQIPKLRAKHLLVIGVCVAYVLSPVDLAPELVLGPLGLGDDLVAVVAAIGVYVAGVRGKRLPGS